MIMHLLGSVVYRALDVVSRIQLSYVAHSMVYRALDCCVSRNLLKFALERHILWLANLNQTGGW
jgi:hypothetical protein